MREYRCFSRHLATGLLCASLSGVPLLAQAQSGRPVFEQEQAHCTASGLQGEALQACLRDAGAAQQERNQGRANPTADEARLQSNALKRCDRLPADRQQECRDMMSGQQAGGTLSIQGSVQGGGVLRELSIPVAR